MCPDSTLGKKRVLSLLELVIISSLLRLLGTELGSSGEQQVLLTAESSL